MLAFKRFFFPQDGKCQLSGPHLNRVLRDNHFHSVPDEGEVVSSAVPCKLLINERNTFGADPSKGRFEFSTH